jgi:hypothetical protein
MSRGQVSVLGRFLEERLRRSSIFACLPDPLHVSRAVAMPFRRHHLFLPLPLSSPREVERLRDGKAVQMGRQAASGAEHRRMRARKKGATTDKRGDEGSESGNEAKGSGFLHRRKEKPAGEEGI